MTNTIKDIRNGKPGPRHCNRHTIASCLCIACIAALLCICGYPVEIGWSRIDIIFNHAIIGIMAIGLSCVIASKTYPKFSIIDYLVIIPYGYLLWRYYINDIFPANGIAIHATYSFFLYLALRLLFSGSNIKGRVLQGNNYRDMGAYDLAEQAYLKAWHTMPNRIYPLYRLMKLHEQGGYKEQAALYAEKIINFKEKIKSPAVNDMKKEAKELIEHER